MWINIILGLRAAFLLVSVLLCFSFVGLAWQFARGAALRRQVPVVHRFAFAVWLGAAGAAFANANHIFDALTGRQKMVFSTADIPTVIGLVMMTVAYFMHVSSKIEAMEGDARRFWIYGGGAVALVGIGFALVPRFL